MRKAIDDALDNEVEVTVSGVAKAAGVSRPFLYDHFDEAIKHAQQQQRESRAEGASLRRPRHPAADDGLRAELHFAHEEIKRLKDDVETVRRQLRQDVGARIEQRQAASDDRVAEKQQEIERLLSAQRAIDADLRTLRRQVQRLEADLAAERRAHSQTAALLNSHDAELDTKNVVPLR